MATPATGFNASSTTFSLSPGVITAKNGRLSNIQKRQITYILSLNYNDNKLKYGMIKKVALDYYVSRITICTIWKAVLKSIKEGVLPDVDRKYKGANKRYALDLEQVKSIPLHLRTNIRTLTCQLSAPKSTVHRLVQKGKIRSHSNAIKPFLITPNMEARIKFVSSHIETSTLHQTQQIKVCF